MGCSRHSTAIVAAAALLSGLVWVVTPVQLTIEAATEVRMLQWAWVVEQLAAAPETVLLPLEEATPLVVLRSRLVLLAPVWAVGCFHISPRGTVQLMYLRIHKSAIIQQTAGSAASDPITVHLTQPQQRYFLGRKLVEVQQSQNGSWKSLLFDTLTCTSCISGPRARSAYTMRSTAKLRVVFR